MITQKKAQALVNVFIAFFVAFIAIMLIYFFVLGVQKFGSAETHTMNIFVDDVSKSNICNYDLVNFLRMKDDFGLTYAERLAFDKDFEEKTTDFFNNHYVRGDATRKDWKMDISTLSFEPITSLGNMTDTDVNDTCKQIIPRNNGDLVIVRLGVEY